jgi:hypothetical protein
MVNDRDKRKVLFVAKASDNRYLINMINKSDGQLGTISDIYEKEISEARRLIKFMPKEHTHNIAAKCDEYLTFLLSISPVNENFFKLGKKRFVEYQKAGLIPTKDDIFTHEMKIRTNNTNLHFHYLFSVFEQLSKQYKRSGESSEKSLATPLRMFIEDSIKEFV